MLYLDYAGSSLLNKEMFDKIYNSTNFLNLFGNPSSSHNIGIRAKQLLDIAREALAHILSCETEEIIFTSGGTESDNMALFGIMYSDSPKYANRNELIVSKVEHPAILESAKELEKRGFVVKYIDVKKNGMIDIQQLKNNISKNTRLVSIMTVNNETGVIQPIKEIYQLTQKYGAVFHTDAVQSIGINPIDTSYCDLLSLSGHKFGALKGTGVLYKKKDIDIKPLIFGGGQERGLRSGTENVFGDYMLVTCLSEAVNNWDKNRQRIEKLRNDFENKLSQEFKDKVIFNNRSAPRVCNNINLSFKGIDSKTLQVMLMTEGIDVSIGSACHSNSEEISYVLKEMKVPNDYINGTLRITLNYNNTEGQILDILFNTLSRCVKYIYNIMEGEM